MAVVSVLTSSTTLLAAAEYKQIVISNRGANTVWCEFGATAVVDSGFPIDANDKIIIRLYMINIGPVGYYEARK